MLERAMWKESGSRSGLVLMMMERDAPTNYAALDTMLTTTNIGIDFPTFLGDASPRRVRTYMSMPAAACGDRHQHISLYFSGRCVAQKSKEIYADAFGSRQPQAST